MQGNTIQPHVPSKRLNGSNMVGCCLVQPMCRNATNYLCLRRQQRRDRAVGRHCSNIGREVLQTALSPVPSRRYWYCWSCPNSWWVRQRVLVPYTNRPATSDFCMPTCATILQLHHVLPFVPAFRRLLLRMYYCELSVLWWRHWVLWWYCQRCYCRHTRLLVVSSPLEADRVSLRWGRQGFPRLFSP